MKIYTKIFDRGDLVVLTNGDYRDLDEGIVGVVVSHHEQSRLIINVQFPYEPVWGFPQNELAHLAQYNKEKKCK